MPAGTGGRSQLLLGGEGEGRELRANGGRAVKHAGWVVNQSSTARIVESRA